MENTLTKPPRKMLSKAKNIITSDLIKVSFLNGIAQVVRMLTGLVSVKVVAALIGPSGIALLGQLNNFSTILLSLSNGGINAGITKYVSENQENESEYSGYIGTGFWITTLLSFAISFTLIFGAGYFSRSILMSEEYRPVFYIFGATIIFYSLSALLIAVLNGFKEYRKYVIINISGSIIGLIFSIILAFRFGSFGALVAAVTFQSVVFIVILALLSKTPWFHWRKIVPAFSKKKALNLGHYTFMALASAITIPAGQMIVRNFIVQHQSITDAGIWEGINRISSMYLTVITLSLGVYYLPRLAEIKSRFELRKEVWSVYKIIMPLLTLMTIGIFAFRFLIVKILFTDEFHGMEDLFAYQLLGDLLKIAGWVLGYILIAKKMTRIYITMEIVNFLLLIGSSYFLVNYLGAKGATIAFALVYLIYLIVLMLVFRNLLFKKQEINQE